METPFGPPSDPYVIGELEGRQVAFLARHGRGHRLSALGAQLPRQHLRVQGARRRLADLGERRGLHADALRADARRRAGPVLRSNPAPRRHVLRRRARGPRFHGRSGVPAAGGGPFRGFCGRGGHRARPRHLPVHGGAAVLDPRRVQGLPAVGDRRHRNDEPAGSQAGARGRDVLRDPGDGHRLRLLARGRGGRGGGERARGVAAECDDGPGDREAGGPGRSTRALRARGPAALRDAIITDRSTVPWATVERLAPIVGQVLRDPAGTGPRDSHSRNERRRSLLGGHQAPRREPPPACRGDRGGAGSRAERDGPCADASPSRCACARSEKTSTRSTEHPRIA